MRDMTSQRVEAWVPEWTFGDRIRKIRRAQGLTQAEFAQRLGVGDRAASSWEAMDRTPREVVSIAKRIELAFGVPATWVLGLDTHEAPQPNGPGGVQAGIPDTSGYRGTSSGGAGRLLAAVA